MQGSGASAACGIASRHADLAARMRALGPSSCQRFWDTPRCVVPAEHLRARGPCVKTCHLTTCWTEHIRRTSWSQIDPYDGSRHYRREGPQPLHA